jgi:hypothetical protein
VPGALDIADDESRISPFPSAMRDASAPACRW